MEARQKSDDRRRPREAFSLVEMLVVIAIIAIMASMAFVVLGRTGEAAREASTKSALKILNASIRERLEAYHDLTASMIYSDPDTPAKTKNRLFRSEYERFLSLYRRVYPNPPQFFEQPAEVYVRKTMFKSLFPQRIEDLYGYNGVLDGSTLIDDSPILARMFDRSSGSAVPITGSWYQRNIDDDRTESSELLYLVLTSGDIYGLPTSDLDGIDQGLIGDTDNDGNLEFLDAWGQPLQFYNWPTRLIKDNGATYSGFITVNSTNYPTARLLISNLPNPDSNGGAVSAIQSRSRIDRDPDDVLRWMGLSGNPLRSAFNLSAGTPYAAVPLAPAGFHDPNTYSSPLIVSAGPDGVLGLYLPTATPNLFGASNSNAVNHLARVIPTEEACQGLTDNITNLQRGPQ